MVSAEVPVAVALLYQTSQLGGHLRDALKEVGAAVVYEALTADIDRDALEGSGARVVVVNLDAETDAHIDHVYDLLDAGNYQVVFNDAQVSSQLQGWDHARWARHLAAKIMRKPEIATPARPVGAQSVPTPVQKSAAEVPVAEKPGVLPFESLVRARVQVPSAPKQEPQQPVPEVAETRIPQAQATPIAEPDPIVSEDAVDLDFAAALRDFANQGVTPQAPTQIESQQDFAAELDALFAEAGRATEQGYTTPVPELELPRAEPTLNVGAPPPPALDTDFEFGNVLEPEPGADVGNLFDDLSLDPSASGQDPSIQELSAEFPAVFDQLDQAAAGVPVAIESTFKPATLPPIPASEIPLAEEEPTLPMEWSLEPLDDTPPGPAVPAGSAAKPPAVDKTFGIEKISAQEFLAPEVDAPSEKQAPVVPPGDFTFELMPMEEAVAPTSSNPAYQSESWLDGSRPAKKLTVGTGAGIQRVFVLGASIGGPEAVREFLAALPAGFPMLFVLAQHMGEEFLELMSAQLAKATSLTVRNPTHGERVGQGEVLVVPTTHRLQVDSEGVITLAHLPDKPPYSPSIDQVLRDVADRFGDKAGAIIFSGMAHDAIEGSQYLRSKGGVIWAQDPDTCVISSMVDGAREAGVVSFIGSPKQLAEKIIADYGKA